MAKNNKVIIDLTKDTDDMLIDGYREIDLNKVVANWDQVIRAMDLNSKAIITNSTLKSLASVTKDLNLSYLHQQSSIIQKMAMSMTAPMPSVNQYLIDNIASLYSSIDLSPHEAFIKSIRATIIEMNKANTSLIQNTNLDYVFNYYENLKRPDRKGNVSKEHIHEQVLNIIDSIKEFTNIGDFIKQALRKIDALNDSKVVKTLGTILLFAQVKDIVFSMFGVLNALIISVSPANQADVEHIENLKADFEEFTNIESTDSIIDDQVKIVTHEMLVREGDKKKSSVIGFVEEGDVVLIAEKKRNWTKVGFYNDNGKLTEGWVLTRYLKEIAI
ncbi:hypothetical protein JCM19047_4588 [Bacillus sp. JCM 19047]|nr:hypothetical protein JCM19047_4588 [Bacillus sp. JCM 19047]